MVEQSGIRTWVADLQAEEHEHAPSPQAPPSGQVPHVPPHPSSPQAFPSHEGSQGAAQVPSSHTVPKAPQFMVEQSASTT